MTAVPSPGEYRRILYDKLPIALDATCKLLINAAASGRPLPHTLSIQEIAIEAKLSQQQLYAVKDGLIQELRTAGWFVSYESDQRDGDYFRFGSSPV